MNINSTGISDISIINNVMKKQLDNDIAQINVPFSLKSANFMGGLNKKRCKNNLKETTIYAGDTTYNQQGGVFILTDNPEKVFYNFIHNSNIELLTQPDSSAYGIILKCKLKENVTIEDPQMNYWRLNTKSIINKGGLEKVDSLCIKIGFVSETDKVFQLNFADGSLSSYEKSSTTKMDADLEVTTQIVVSKTTNLNFESVCPYIVFSKIYEDKRTIESFISKLINSSNNNSDLKKIINGIKVTCLNPKNKFKLSVIGMELLENAETLEKTISSHDGGVESIFSDTNLRKYEGIMFMYFHELIRTAVESKILLFDAKLSNVLYIKDYTYYDEIKIRDEDELCKGRAVFIDFGQIYPMNKSEINEFSYERFKIVSSEGEYIDYFAILMKIFDKLIKLIPEYNAYHANTNYCMYLLLMGITTNTYHPQPEDILVMKKELLAQFAEDNKKYINDGLNKLFEARKRKIESLLAGEISIFGILDKDEIIEKIGKLSKSVKWFNKSLLYDIVKQYKSMPQEIIPQEQTSVFNKFLKWITICKAEINDVVDPVQHETGLSMETVLAEVELPGEYFGLSSDYPRVGGKKTRMHYKKRKTYKKRRSYRKTKKYNVKQKFIRRFSKMVKR
uniref:Uncharacterized protein n=1 Tax=viral metagenome TaxID=1070528 RepID=A0A6C0D255_9ZZZZ